MNAFIKDIRRGYVIGFKAALTGWIVLGVLCMSMTGVGFLMAPMILSDALDAIWD